MATSPHFKRLLNVILDALRGKEFEAARQAVMEALEREARGAKHTEAA